MSETSMQRLWTLINLAVEAHEEDSIESPFDETTTGENGSVLVFRR